MTCQFLIRQFAERTHLHALQCVKQGHGIRDDGANTFDPDLEVRTAF
jgi:hypothetical protein